MVVPGTPRFGTCLHRHGNAVRGVLGVTIALAVTALLAVIAPLGAITGTALWVTIEAEARAGDVTVRYP